MSPWKSDAPDRLAGAALELYWERGFAQVTVAEIAARAGLAERTFFRYFVDKREVLFWGWEAFQEALVNALGEAPAALPPIDAVGAALEALAFDFQARRDSARRRQEIIAANADLQERERIKFASLVSALAEGLRQRGVSDLAAMLTAEVGIAVFRIAFACWIEESNALTFPLIIHASLNELKAITTASGG